MYYSLEAGIKFDFQLFRKTDSRSSLLPFIRYTLTPSLQNTGGASTYSAGGSRGAGIWGQRFTAYTNVCVSTYDDVQ